jgi:CHAD domain-containing protein
MTTTTTPTSSRARSTQRAKPVPAFRALILDSLHERWRIFRAELKRCQKKYSEEAVHDLRVATRRLISTLDLVASIDPEADVRKTRRTLKRQLDMFGPLRDVQVQLLSIEKLLPSFPELQAFYDFLLKRERKLKQRLGTELKRVKTGKIERGIDVATREVDTLLDTPAMQQEKRAAAIQAIEIAFNRVVERKQLIVASDSASIHRMRVAFKKFRYMVESLAPLRGLTTSKRLKAMDAFQGSMGDIQDAEVLLTSVQAFAPKLGMESEASLARALAELSRRRTDLIETFLGAVDTMFTFWKPVGKVNGVR